MPVPVPSWVLLLEIVGPEVLLQHTPRCVIVAPPSEVIVLERVAVVIVTTALPVETGASGSVNNAALLQLPVGKISSMAMTRLRLKCFMFIGFNNFISWLF